MSIISIKEYFVITAAFHYFHRFSLRVLICYRSLSSHREVRPMRSFSRNSKNSNIPNNMSEKSRSSIKMHVDDEKLLDTSCDPTSDVIVMMNPSSNGKTNSFTTSKTWSKALLRIAKSKDSSETCLTQAEDSKNNILQRGETSM